MKLKCLGRVQEAVVRHIPRWTGLAWFTLVVAPAVWGQGTLSYRVGFDGAPNIARGSSALVPQYNEQGVHFQAIGDIPTESPYHLGRVGGGISGLPENGTAYLNAPFTCSLAVTRLDGARFGVVSLDLAEYSTLFAVPAMVPFVGYRPDGSQVRMDFTTDGIIDGTGPLADFETFYFDARFSDLVRLEVPTYGWALDNMVFSQVPEPGVGSLCGLAAAAMLCRWRVFGRNRIRL